VSGNRVGNSSTRGTAGVNRPNNRNGAISDRRGQTSRPTTPRPSNEAALSRQNHIFARENGAQHRDQDKVDPEKGCFLPKEGVAELIDPCLHPVLFLISKLVQATGESKGIRQMALFFRPTGIHLLPRPIGLKPLPD